MQETSEINAAGAPHAARLLHEDDVVLAVMSRLTADGWAIESHALSHQHGDDVVAMRDSERLIVEAKGEGSSRIGSRRHGLAFTGNQVKTHVAVAVTRAMRVVSQGSARAAIALPDNRPHRLEIARIAPALSALTISVYWVAHDGGVTLEP